MTAQRMASKVAAAGVLILLAFAALPATALAATITADETADELNTDGDCSLREAVQSANTDAAVDACVAGSGDDTITLRANTYTLSLGGIEDLNANGDLDIRTNITINGAGAASTFINGGAIDRVLEVFFGVTLTLNGVTITNGSVGPSGSGGGIFNFRGVVILIDSSVTNNAAGGPGGGIYSLIGMTTILIDSTVGNNTAGGRGGGILIEGGPLTLINSTVNGNTADDRGGGIFFNPTGTLTTGYLTIINSTVSNNTAGSAGGGLLLSPATASESTPSGSTISGSTISGNTATTAGGGISSIDGTLTISNSTISGNSAGPFGGGAIATVSGNATTVVLVNTTVSDNAAASSITVGPAPTPTPLPKPPTFPLYRRLIRPPRLRDGPWCQSLSLSSHGTQVTFP